MLDGIVNQNVIIGDFRTISLAQTWLSFLGVLEYLWTDLIKFLTFSTPIWPKYLIGKKEVGHK